MLLKVKPLHLLAGRPIAILHEETAHYLNLHAGERIRIKSYGKRKEIVAPIDITGGRTILSHDEIALSQEITKELHLKSKGIVDITPALRPLSLSYIHKKLDNHKLTFTEIYSIISDIVNNELTEAEVAFFVASTYLNGMDLEETAAMTQAMVKTGHQLKLNKQMIIDKHGIGGIEGNRTTPIVVSLIAAAIDQLKLNAAMPKTSSRAITSAAGTADVIETVARVEFSMPELQGIINKTNACLVWGGSLGLAPADDKIIQVERILALDPEAQLIASILSKKLSVGATHVLIDISYGKDAKVKDRGEAEKLKDKFEKIAAKLGLNIKVVLTDGSQPIGNGIGPLLEMRDVFLVLKQEQNKPLDLEQRSVFLATEILSFVLNMKREEAETIIRGILLSGQAFKKFEQIIEAQHGSLGFLDKIKLGRFRYDFKANRHGTIAEISNRKMSHIARMAGSPADKGAGIFLYKHVGQQVKKNEKLFTIFAETRDKLNYAIRLSQRTWPVLVK
ncbi:MAG: thymidine phosphorylase [Candidatus Pacearchaeota archaeon]|nr:thymidine phosphorylase [Candidatus Pacearchaeota archaeon]